MHGENSEGIELAYRDAEYWVLADPPFCLAIDVPSHSLRRLHEQYGVTCSALLTAFNPHSERLADDLNQSRQHSLRKQLQSMGLNACPAVNSDPKGLWPDEESVLVFGIERDDAEALARQFQQKAFLWNGADSVPHLIWC